MALRRSAAMIINVNRQRPTSEPSVGSAASTTFRDRPVGKRLRWLPQRDDRLPDACQRRSLQASRCERRPTCAGPARIGRGSADTSRGPCDSRMGGGRRGYLRRSQTPGPRPGPLGIYRGGLLFRRALGHRLCLRRSSVRRCFVRCETVAWDLSPISKSTSGCAIRRTRRRASDGWRVPRTVKRWRNDRGPARRHEIPARPRQDECWDDDVPRSGRDCRHWRRPGRVDACLEALVGGSMPRQALWRRRVYFEGPEGARRARGRCPAPDTRFLSDLADIAEAVAADAQTPRWH